MSIILQFNHFLIVLISQTICFYSVGISCVGFIFSEKLATTHKDYILMMTYTYTKMLLLKQY